MKITIEFANLIPDTLNKRIKDILGSEEVLILKIAEQARFTVSMELFTDKMNTLILYYSKPEDKDDAFIIDHLMIELLSLDIAKEITSEVANGNGIEYNSNAWRKTIFFRNSIKILINFLYFVSYGPKSLSIELGIKKGNIYYLYYVISTDSKEIISKLISNAVNNHSSLDEKTSQFLLKTAVDIDNYINARKVFPENDIIKSIESL